MKNIINLEDYKDTFIISYDGELHSVEANTFANSIVSISRVIEEINYLISPDSKVEIRIEAIDKGSFKPTIKVCKKIWGKVTPFLPEKKDTVTIFIATLALLNNSNEDSIIIKDDQVIIETSNSKILIPKEIYNNANKIKEQKNIKSEISSSFQILDNDPSIAGFTIQKELSDNTFPFKTIRNDFSRFTNMCSLLEEGDTNKRRQIEKTTLQLIKVILEKGRRKWEFAWKGIKISAPVLDDSFWDKMAKGDVSIKQGDSIDVDLQIVQVLDPYSKVYFNESYEVITVNNYIPAPHQDYLF